MEEGCVLTEAKSYGENARSERGKRRAEQSRGEEKRKRKQGMATSSQSLRAT